jgi:glucose-1-phosphate thymidylyltransferase
MLGIIPAAGAGTRIQPLAFSKELLPVGTRTEQGIERPRAVSEYLIERLIAAGATRLCFVISPGKSDILGYFGGQVDGVPVCYAVQESPEGLCDAIFCARPFMRPDEAVLVGLPDTIWFPRAGLRDLPDDQLSFLLFPVDQPHLFDAVSCDDGGAVKRIEVKQPRPSSSWIWGAWKAPGPIFEALWRLWIERGRQDPYIGTLVNAFIDQGGRAVGVKTGSSYVDVGTLHGYREAFALLQRLGPPDLPSPIPSPIPAPVSTAHKRSHAVTR